MGIAAPATAAATRWLPTSSTATTRGTAGCCSLTCRLSWRTRPARLSTPAPSGPSPPPRGRLLREAAGLQQRSGRSEEHTSELQSLMRISYAVFCLKKKKKEKITNLHQHCHNSDP